MKFANTLKPPALTSALLALTAAANAHEHLAAGANSTTSGSPLIFVNAGDYATNSAYVFGLDAGDPGSPYDGWYYTGDLVFVALAATPAYGGPEAQAAAIGSHIEIVLETVAGPAGATLGFWETQQNGVDSTNLTWTVQVGLTNGTNHIVVSETDGSPTADPYGHIHGRIYSVDRPGLYTVGFRFVDRVVRAAHVLRSQNDRICSSDLGWPAVTSGNLHKNQKSVCNFMSRTDAPTTPTFDCHARLVSGPLFAI